MRREMKKNGKREGVAERGSGREREWQREGVAERGSGGGNEQKMVKGRIDSAKEMPA